MKNILNKEMVTEALKHCLLVLRAICLFFIPQSIESIEKLSIAPLSEWEQDDLNLAEQYASLWNKSTELLPPFCHLFRSIINVNVNHNHIVAVKHASLVLNTLGFIAMVCFTEILKACQYSVLDKTSIFIKSINRYIKTHNSILAVVCFFLQ